MQMRLLSSRWGCYISSLQIILRLYDFEFEYDGLCTYAMTVEGCSYVSSRRQNDYFAIRYSETPRASANDSFHCQYYDSITLQPK